MANRTLKQNRTKKDYGNIKNKSLNKLKGLNDTDISKILEVDNGIFLVREDTDYGKTPITFLCLKKDIPIIIALLRRLQDK